MRNWRIAISSALWILAGCNGGVALEQYPAELADSYCRLGDACVGRLATGVGGTVACRTQLTRQLENTLLGQLSEAVERGTLIYHPDLAGTCLAEAEALGCELTIAASPASCRDAFEGTIPLGQPCSLSQECEGDAYCEGAACPATPGTCTARGGDGEPCVSADECQDGLVCQAMTCQPPASTSGGPCGGTTGLSCPLDEMCVFDGITGEGMCTPFSSFRTRGLDEACDAMRYELCLPELSCAITGIDGGTLEQSCKAVAPSGGSCFQATPSMCPAGEYCDAEAGSGMIEGTCRPLPGEGEDCSAADFRCASGLSCESGSDGLSTCVRLADNGEACENDEACLSRRCESGACVAPPLCS